MPDIDNPKSDHAAMVEVTRAPINDRQGRCEEPAEEVIQADREAAADAYALLGFGPCQHIIDGAEDDIGLVQAFARHRAQSGAAS